VFDLFFIIILYTIKEKLVNEKINLKKVFIFSAFSIFNKLHNSTINDSDLTNNSQYLEILLMLFSLI